MVILLGAFATLLLAGIAGFVAYSYAKARQVRMAESGRGPDGEGERLGMAATGAGLPAAPTLPEEGQLNEKLR
jgi:hypothetical protein